MSTHTIDGPRIEQQVLKGLKGFQKSTVVHVFKRMYLDADPAERFLVADEVGLGKTLVARGLVAKVIRHLQERGTPRIDIIYICSNADIARQNASRLNVTGLPDIALATRITLLPVHLHRLSKHGVNFDSFTPGTSFNMRSQGGTGEERAVIFRLLEYALDESLARPGAYETLRAGMREQNFRSWVSWIKRVDPGKDGGLDLTLASAFKTELATRPDLISRFRRLVETAETNEAHISWYERISLIGELRKTLARSCVEALEPDLVILDEFQRFRELLEEPDPDNPDDIRHLVHHLFRQPEARTLLLSATPYKMYTLRGEEQDDHYADFLKTTSFLMGQEETRHFASDLRAFRRALIGVGTSGNKELMRRKQAVERQLRRYMCRTERLAVVGDRNGMLADRTMPGTRLDARDVKTYAMVDTISQALNTGDITEYWKSSPYLLNFMSEYKLKRELRNAAADPAKAGNLASSIDTSLLLDRATLASYESLDPGNARLRGLAAETVDRGAWKVLWLPPSLPYYLGRGAYADPNLTSFTKRLIFSSWNVVPDAISMALSFEAERRMMLNHDPNARNTQEDRARLRGLLAIRRQDDRPAGMSTFGFLYPCVTLAELVDPLHLARDAGAPDRVLTCEEILEEATRRISALLAPMTRNRRRDGPEDQRWYWAAPLLLDYRRWPKAATREWLASSAVVRAPGATEGADEDDSGAWLEHIALARTVLEQGLRGIELGRVPEDLASTTAVLALGAPGTCALRSIARVLGAPGNLQDRLANPKARDAALRIAWGFRTLFNIPEVMSLLRPSTEQDGASYWRRSAEEGLNGNLQAVLDEYIHLLPEWLGLLGRDFGLVAREIGNVVHDAVAIRAANYSFDELYLEDGRLHIQPVHMRARFALRFGQVVSDDQQMLLRSSGVRAAFNSPFWPFVLTSTSVGQEGLDFHLYCHAIVHWNLPANPVDLEQREGRVHRYKGHAIRKNVAHRHLEAAFARRSGDPWASMFESAGRSVSSKRSKGLEPFWVYEGPAQSGTCPSCRSVAKLNTWRSSSALSPPTGLSSASLDRKTWLPTSKISWCPKTCTNLCMTFQ